MVVVISVSYQCEFGFHYLVAGASVWIFFLPFYILTLFGNCWRQCCCCFCDPVVRKSLFENESVINFLI